MQDKTKNFSTGLSFENGRLSLTVRGEGFMSFSVGDELICVGNGKSEYSMSHGSFKIKERIAEKKPLKIGEITFSSEKAVIALNEGCCCIEESESNTFRFSFEGLDGYNRMWFKLPAEKSESVYGCGEIFPKFNLRGEKVNAWVAEHVNALQITKKLIKMCFGSENTTKRQKFSKYETYYAQPTFLSSRKYFYHSETTARTQFDFKNEKYHEIQTDSVSAFYLGFGADFESVLSSLTLITGRQPELPAWVYNGDILGVQGGTDIMMKKVETALKSGINVAGVWIQDWEGRRVTAVGKQLFWNWQWDKELYPGLDEKIKELNARGIKVLGYCNPFLAVEKPLYKIASEKGYCVKDKDGKDYYVKITTFPAAMIDLTNPEAYGWLKSVIKENMVDFGFSGWMADFGEYLPTDCVLHSGEDPELVHNTWPAIWAKLNREVVEETGNLGKIMFFTRAGFTGTPRFSTMMWNGDNHVDYSIDFGLPSVIPAMLSLTCSGFGLSHSDIGGYTTFMKLKRSEELYMRWCEMNAFSVLMRGHEGLNPDLNAQFDASEAVLKHGAKMSVIHKKLAPYIESAVKYNSDRGVGAVRPLFFYYDETEAYKEEYEYLLGRDVLVAPVLKKDANSREVYLPDDEWIHIETKKEYGGGRYTVPAPLGEIPVFVRKSASEDVLDILLNLY